MEQNQINQLSQTVVDAAVSVHKTMGPGLLESIYEACLMKELELRGIAVRKQVPIALKYKGYALQKEYAIDLLVNETIVLELKAVEALLPVHQAQLISYLKLSNKRLGFLLNFNVPVMKDGIKRIANNF